MKPLDEKDREILRVRQENWDKIPGARVGDYCIMPDGDKRRFTHDWGDGLQTTLPKSIDASFYMGAGHIAFSGSLDSIVPRVHLIDTGETAPGVIWFFHHNESRAHNAVYAHMNCRVFNCCPASCAMPKRPT